MTDSTKDARPPKSTKFKNWESFVQIQVGPNFRFGSVPRDTKESEFVDSVGFGGVVLTLSYTTCLLKLKVSFAKEPYKRDYFLQKRPMILRSLLIVDTPWSSTGRISRVPYTTDYMALFYCFYIKQNLYMADLIYMYISPQTSYTCLFGKRALWKRLFSAKETYDFKKPTHLSHPISMRASYACMWQTL